MKKLLLSLSIIGSSLFFGQINNTEGFETSNGSFTNVGFFRSKSASFCSGEYALIRNLYSGALTGSTTFSSSASSGAAIDVSFSYRTFNYPLDASKKVSGEMVVEYSKDDGQTYSPISTIDLTSIFTCKTFTYKIQEGLVPANSKFKFRVTGNQKTDGDFYLILDDFKFTPATLAVSELSKNKIGIYPNPVSDVLNLSDYKNVKSVTVSDITGRQLKTVANPDSAIQLKDLKAGSYIVTINNIDGTSHNTKIIKK